MSILRKIVFTLVAAFVLVILALNVWGMVTLGTLTPAETAELDPDANRVVMVFGATGSVGDGLLKAAMLAPEVTTVYAVTRRMSPRLEAGAESGRVKVIMHEDFTDYSMLSEQLAEVNTVLWGLGTTSVGADPDTYRWIHVDFPVSFVEAWLAARTAGPMAFHNVTGMGTGEQEDAQWAKDKGFAERRVAELAKGTGLRTFGHHSGLVRPTSENANALTYIVEWLAKPGHLVIRGVDLGRAMFEISARVEEIPSGTVIDNLDAIRYAEIYNARSG